MNDFVSKRNYPEPVPFLSGSYSFKFSWLLLENIKRSAVGVANRRGKHKSNDCSSRGPCGYIPGHFFAVLDSLVTVTAHQSGRKSRSGSFRADNDDNDDDKMDKLITLPLEHACGVMMLA